MWLFIWFCMVIGAFSESYRTGLWVLGSSMFLFVAFVTCSERERRRDRDEYARSTSR